MENRCNKAENLHINYCLIFVKFNLKKEKLPTYDILILSENCVFL